MKIKMSFISVAIVLIVVLLIFVFFMKSGNEKNGIDAGSGRQAIDKAKNVSAEVDISSIKSALSLYMSSNGYLPESLNQLTPRYLRRMPTDPWGRDFKYEKLNERECAIISAGKDGIFNSSDDIKKVISP